MEDYGNYGQYEIKDLPGELMDEDEVIQEHYNGLAQAVTFANPELIATVELVDYEGFGLFWTDKFTAYIFLNDEELRQAVYHGAQSGVYFEFRYYMEPRPLNPEPLIF